MSDVVISLVWPPAVSLHPGLDDILWVGRHPGTDPSQAPSWRSELSEGQTERAKLEMFTYKQPQVVILSAPAEDLK